MEEIKVILLDVQKSLVGLQGLEERLEKRLEAKMEQKFEEFEARMDQKMEQKFEEFEIRMDQKTDRKIEASEKRTNNKFSMQLQAVEQRLMEEIRKLNQRLVLYQEEIGRKVDILIDADNARCDLLEIHDSEIREIKEQQFNLTARVSNLETRVIGA